MPRRIRNPLKLHGSLADIARSFRPQRNPLKLQGKLADVGRAFRRPRNPLKLQGSLAAAGRAFRDPDESRQARRRGHRSPRGHGGIRGRKPGTKMRYGTRATSRYQSLWLRYQRSLSLTPIQLSSTRYQFQPTRRRARLHEVSTDNLLPGLIVSGSTSVSGTTACTVPTASWAWTNPNLVYSAEIVQHCLIPPVGAGGTLAPPLTSLPAPLCNPGYRPGTQALRGLQYSDYYTVIYQTSNFTLTPDMVSGESLDVGGTSYRKLSYDGPGDGTGGTDSYARSVQNRLYAADRLSTPPFTGIQTDFSGFYVPAAHADQPQFYSVRIDHLVSYQYYADLATGDDPDGAGSPCSDSPYYPPLGLQGGTPTDEYALAGGSWTSNTITFAQASRIQILVTYSTSFAATVDSFATWNLNGVTGTLVIPARPTAGSAAVFETIDIPAAGTINFALNLNLDSHIDGAIVKIGGAYTCTCADYAKKHLSFPSRYRSELSDRDWVATRAGTPGFCKHIMATKRVRGEPIDLYQDDLKDIRQWRKDKTKRRAATRKAQRKAEAQFRRDARKRVKADLRAMRKRDKAELDGLTSYRDYRSSARSRKRAAQEEGGSDSVPFDL